MERREKLVYHQVHPIKLLTDVLTSFSSSWLLWRGWWWVAAAVVWLPSIVVSIVLVAAADLGAYAQRPIGRYAARHLGRGRITALRFGGQAVMWAGAAAHLVALLPLGAVVVADAWLSGVRRPRGVVVGTKLLGASLVALGVASVIWAFGIRRHGTSVRDGSVRPGEVRALHSPSLRR